jgi:hypothetical protein
VGARARWPHVVGTLHQRSSSRWEEASGAPSAALAARGWKACELLDSPPNQGLLHWGAGELHHFAVPRVEGAAAGRAASAIACCLQRAKQNMPAALAAGAGGGGAARPLAAARAACLPACQRGWGVQRGGGPGCGRATRAQGGRWPQYLVCIVMLAIRRGRAHASCLPIQMWDLISCTHPWFIHGIVNAIQPSAPAAVSTRTQTAQLPGGPKPVGAGCACRGRPLKLCCGTAIRTARCFSSEVAEAVWVMGVREGGAGSMTV